MTRFGYVMTTYFCVLAIGIASFVPVPLRLVWNASASVPIGLYGLEPPRDLRVGDLVAVAPSRHLADFMVERGYLGRGVPLMKHVAALPGQIVCRLRSTITVDGAALGEALDRDSKGRRLPVWQGCRRVAVGTVFLMNSAVRDSLDGRYFGPIPARTIIGRATPIYTDEAANGQFVWRPNARQTAR
ncbi:S26 family signal peptidase [Sphingobium sp. R-21]|jgi:conjugative transfer signal peptidase TraF|uniref:S26 family signal peptidase n=1 Tax=Sphingobium sp. R-21 TaxID=3404056 RepID=UPI003CEF3A46